VASLRALTRGCASVHFQNYLIGAFGPPCTVSIDFADAETRKQASVKKENGQAILVPLFLGQESVVGEVSCVSFSSSFSLIVLYQKAGVARYALTPTPGLLLPNHALHL
jgi:hypothetical protein